MISLDNRLFGCLFGLAVTLGGVAVINRFSSAVIYIQVCSAIVLVFLGSFIDASTVCKFFPGARSFLRNLFSTAPNFNPINTSEENVGSEVSSISDLEDENYLLSVRLRTIYVTLSSFLWIIALVALVKSGSSIVYNLWYHLVMSLVTALILVTVTNILPNKEYELSCHNLHWKTIKISTKIILYLVIFLIMISMWANLFTIACLWIQLIVLSVTWIYLCCKSESYTWIIVTEHGLSINEDGYTPLLSSHEEV